ncbi:hypothetical protein C9374_001789 [Naegleria lovaniensis]|uniref:RecA family profile 1 domain-containing protein n=1 Tax=Naegleria lovaniensis TaxID=51637 RepID=A0AA88GRC7_NAELO|nr:uncharacterized protein C9374_001789 [Naegleria lovaniensis]KAG2387457.1 hypothetical protein C9374_001789 [Naegleria lovaniensis]
MISLKRKLTTEESEENDHQQEIVLLDDDEQVDLSHLEDDLQTQSSCSSSPLNHQNHDEKNLESFHNVQEEEYYFELDEPTSIPNHQEPNTTNIHLSVPTIPEELNVQQEEENDIDIEAIQELLSEEENTQQHQVPPFVLLNSDTSTLESSSIAESLENDSVNERRHFSNNNNHQTELLFAPSNESFDSSSTMTSSAEQLSSIHTHHLEMMPVESILTKISSNQERVYRATHIVQLLKNQLGIQTVQALLLAQRRLILSIKEISNQDYETIICAAQSLDPTCTPFGFTTASQYHHQMVSKRYHVKTGSNDLDELLGGGVESSAVTEFFGESASGKTQLCHTLAVTAQIPYQADSQMGKVIYIDTSGSFRPERLDSISSRFKLDPNHILDNISYSRVYHCDQQTKNVNEMRKLLNMHQQQQQQNPFRLIIIDSATGLFRTEFKNKDEICERQNKLGQYLESLNKLSEDFNIPIVITNQVMDVFEKPSPFNSPSSSPKVKPVGGHVLAHTVTTRVQFFKEPQQKRRAKIFKSSNRPELSCYFGIYGDGIDNYRNIYDSY